MEVKGQTKVCPTRADTPETSGGPRLRMRLQVGAVPNRRSRGSAWTIIAIIVAVIVLFIFVAPRVTAYYFLSKQVRENPQLSLTPQDLPPAPELRAKPTTIRLYGREMDVPWGEPLSQNEMTYSTSLKFSDSHYLFVDNPENDVHLIDTINQMPDPQQRDLMRRMSGLENVKTRYDAFRLRMETKPEMPSLFSGFEKQAMMMISVNEKVRIVRQGTTALFRFAIGGMRGFQVGTPGARSDIEVFAFDADDQRYHIKFAELADGPPAVTQSEINFIVRSLRRAPAEKPAPATPPVGKAPGKPGRAEAGRRRSRQARAVTHLLGVRQLAAALP